MLPEIWEALAPSVLTAVASLLGLLLTYATWKVERWTGLKIEAQHRQALHSAIMSGVQSAMDGTLDRDQIVAQAVAYARRSVPDAVGYLLGRADDGGILMRLAEAKLREALAGRTGGPT